MCEGGKAGRLLLPEERVTKLCMSDRTVIYGSGMLVVNAPERNLLKVFEA